MFLSAASVQANPVRLSVQPKGTNQIALILSPVEAGISYEVLVRTNGPDGHWITLAGAFFGSSNGTITTTCILSDSGDLKGLTLETLENWNFVAGCWSDTLGDTLPPLYKDLVLLTDPFAYADPEGDPMQDGWSNSQKKVNNMDPYRAYPPPPPQASVAFYQGTNNTLRGHAVLTWQLGRSPVPDYFLIERANRGPRPMTNDFRFRRPPALGVNGRFPTNWPTNFRPTYHRANWQSQEPFVTGPYEVVAQCRGVPGLKEYRYIDPNVDTFFQPLYRIQPHYSPPLRARLDRVDAEEIRKTIVTVAAQPTTDGYSLTVPNPIPYARYLLLVRDRNDSQWRASGYFESGTNREPIYLRVDKKGMMHEGQSPLAMPEMKYLPDVVEPEFAAGWGEDSDGDGLPDIYEVLVTRTDPDNADTGNAGILDGYKGSANDGWNNLEKFRRRADPFTPAQPPSPVVLTQPTMTEAMKAVTSRTDLPYEPKIEVRIVGTTNFQAVDQGWQMLYQMSDPHNPYRVRGNFDFRISWSLPEVKPQPSGYYGP